MMTSLLTRAITSTVVAATAMLALAACSQPEDATTKKTQNPTPTIAEAVYNDCIDGSLQIWDGDETVADKVKDLTFGDCASAVVISGDRTIALGATEDLTVEGSGNTVTLKDPQSLVVLGNDNTITYTGADPKVVDQGTGNTINAEN